LVIAVDNTQISQTPDKWRLGQLMLLSTVLAILLAALSFGHFYVARDIFHVAPYVLHSIMYLHISSGKSTMSILTLLPHQLTGFQLHILLSFLLVCLDTGSRTCPLLYLLRVSLAHKSLRSSFQFMVCLEKVSHMILSH
jgi:hypothetical protein